MKSDISEGEESGQIILYHRYIVVSIPTLFPERIIRRQIDHNNNGVVMGKERKC